MIRRRLKQTRARWRTRRVNCMASLCCLAYNHAWKPYWNALAETRLGKFDSLEHRF